MDAQADNDSLWTGEEGQCDTRFRALEEGEGRGVRVKALAGEKGANDEAQKALR